MGSTKPKRGGGGGCRIVGKIKHEVGNGIVKQQVHRQEVLGAVLTTTRDEDERPMGYYSNPS